MSDYLETFRIPLSSTQFIQLGIEDYEQPGVHFFADQPHKRFRLWSGGCGIGEADTLEEARKILLHYIASDLRVRSDRALADLKVMQRTLNQLGGEDPIDTFKLAKFLVEE